MPAILVGLGIGFYVFAAAVVIVGLAQTHTAAHGSTATPGFLDFISGRWALRTLFGLAAKASSFVASHFAAAQLRLLARWFIGMGTLTLGWFGIQATFAEAVVEALERIEHRGDPKARAKAAKAAGAAAAAAAAAHKGIRIGHSNAADLHHFQTKTDARIKPLHHATTVVLPRDIGRVRTREDALSRDLGKVRERTRELEDGAVKTWKWIRTHPLSGTTAVFTGAVAIALARMGFGFLRCRNWQKVGKRLTCGMGATFLHLLEAVAAFTLGGLSVLRPELLAEAAVAAIDEIEPILAEILRD